MGKQLLRIAGYATGWIVSGLSRDTGATSRIHFDRDLNTVNGSVYPDHREPETAPIYTTSDSRKPRSRHVRSRARRGPSGVSFLRSIEAARCPARLRYPKSRLGVMSIRRPCCRHCLSSGTRPARPTLAYLKIAPHPKGRDLDLDDRARRTTQREIKRGKVT